MLQSQCPDASVSMAVVVTQRVETLSSSAAYYSSRRDPGL